MYISRVGTALLFIPLEGLDPYLLVFERGMQFGLEDSYCHSEQHSWSKTGGTERSSGKCSSAWKKHSAGCSTIHLHLFLILI